MDGRGECSHTNRSWEGVSTSTDDQEEDAESSDVIVGELDVHWGGGSARQLAENRGPLERPTELSLLQHSSPGDALFVAFVLARLSLRRVPSSRWRVQCSKKPTLLKSQEKTSVGHLRRQENQVRREPRRRGSRSRGLPVGHVRHVSCLDGLFVEIGDLFLHNLRQPVENVRIDGPNRWTV